MFSLNRSVALVGTVVLFYAPAVIAAPAAVPLYQNCKVRKGAISKATDRWDFNLRHGDIGGCVTDNQVRHGAPYWERAELRGPNLQTGKAYAISVEFKFDADSKSSDRTSFFQIHSYNNGCTSCLPMLMIKTHASGAITASLQNAKQYHDDVGLGITRTSATGQWRNLRVEISTSPGMNSLSIFIDGKEVIDKRDVYLDPKGIPYLKIGLYRPGSSSALPDDRISIRHVMSELLR
jgi:hypothetical protein